MKTRGLSRHDDIEFLNYEKDIGRPGRFPFTRGIYPNMYRGKLWTVRQYAGFGTPEEANKRLKELLSAGQNGLSIAFDLPTQLGLDSDNKLARGEVGRVGVAIDTIEDMELLLKDIPIDKISISMTINATAIILMAMYITVAEKRRIDIRQLRGTIQNDILKEYIARGNYIYPLEPSLKITSDIVLFCLKEMPKWMPISISGYHIREAGANAVQELALTFLNALTYIEQFVGMGSSPKDFLSKFSFFFSVHNDFIEEIAKFRAARRLWARLIKKRVNVYDEKSCRLKFHAQTAGCTLTAKEPDNNVIRVTIQALAAVLGGAQSLHTNSRDEAISLPSKESAILALMTQYILAYESGVINTVDPLGGSYAIERLTCDIEEKVHSMIERIEKHNGMKQAIVTGTIQREIEEAAYLYHREIECGERIIVGVNRYESNASDIPSITPFSIPKQVEIAQINRLKRVKKQRDRLKVNNVLKDIKNALERGDNLVEPVIAAVKANTTIGEISQVFEKVYGRHKENRTKR